jgi:alpha-mannosidase
MTLSLVPEQGTTSEPLSASDSVLENQHLRAEIAPDGTLASLFDKDSHREILDDRGNQVWAYTDLPREWDAWDVDASYMREGHEIIADHPPELVENGPVRVGVRVFRRVGESTIEQVYRLWAGSSRLEIENRAQWDERRTLLRARFPLKIRAHEAWFETAFGAVPRPTHRNTPWEQARFEVPALRFADMSEAGYGISLLNDCKYGYSARGNEIGLSLLRGSIYPDPYADCGEHRFTYALYSHPGDWRQGVTSQAHDLNAPLQAIVLPGRGSNDPPTRQYLGVEAPHLRLSCLKSAESGDGIILRLYEAHGARGKSALDVSALGINAAFAQIVNLLEDSLSDLDLEDGRMMLDFRPYQVISVLLSTRPAQATLAGTRI